MGRPVAALGPRWCPAGVDCGVTNESLRRGSVSRSSSAFSWLALPAGPNSGVSRKSSSGSVGAGVGRLLTRGMIDPDCVRSRPASPL